MNETQIADRVRELEARVDALEALHVAPEIPPIPDPPRRHVELAWVIVLLMLLPANVFGWPRLAAWAERLAGRVLQRGVMVAARRGTLAQRTHAARVFGGQHV